MDLPFRAIDADQRYYESVDAGNCLEFLGDKVAS